MTVAGECCGQTVSPRPICGLEASVAQKTLSGFLSRKLESYLRHIDAGRLQLHLIGATAYPFALGSPHRRDFRLTLAEIHRVAQFINRHRELAVISMTGMALSRLGVDSLQSCINVPHAIRKFFATRRATTLDVAERASSQLLVT